MADILVKSINDIDMSDMTLPLITIYNSPKDYQGKVVARVWEGKAASPTNAVILYSSIEAAQKELSIFFPIEKSPQDDPCIVCTYMPNFNIEAAAKGRS